MKRFLHLFQITFFAFLTCMFSLSSFSLIAQNPVVTSNAIGASFSEGGAAIALNNQVSISSSSNITQIIISNRSGASGAEENDLITLSNANGYTITSSANKANWILSGNGTAAQATAALQSAMYQNTGQNPTIFGTNNGRGFDLSVTNASGTTNVNSGDYYSFGFALIINDAPTGVTTNTLTVDNLSTTTIASTHLQAQDPDDHREGLIFTVNNTPTNGNLRLNGATLNVNGTFTQDNINNNQVSYQNTNGSATSDSFSFSLADGGENGTASITNQNFSINIELPDTDNDGTPDNQDGCPNDPNKINPGQCGCGVLDIDSDSDGFADCNDECPNDPNKALEGDCGCGVADMDENENGTSDCLEVTTCPSTTALIINAVTATTATISWTAGGSETEWEVVYGAPNFDPTSEGTPVEVNNTTTTNLTGLTASTEYEVYVKAICAENDESDFTGPISFSTLLANNDCENAIAISCGDTVNGTTIGATESGISNPTCANGTPADAFYTLAVEAGNEYTITINGTNYDGVLAIYSGSCPSLTELDCTDSGYTVNIAETIFFSASITEILTIRTYDWSASRGDFTLSVSCNTPDGFIYENGSWTPSDPNTNAIASDNISVLNGTTSITQALEVSNITVMNGATLNIEDVLTINGNITNNGDMVFKSTANKNGELAAVPSTSTISGDITVERYMSANRGYRTISSPVTTSTSIHANWQEGAISSTDNPNPGFGTHITGSTTDQENGFDGTITGAASLYTLDATNQAFAVVNNTNVKTLDAGEGYLLFYRGSRAIDLTASPSPAADATVLRTTGTLFTGTFTDNINVSNVAGQFNLIGNPYQSSVNINTVITDSQNLDSEFGYVYDPTLGSNGAYVTVILPGGTNNSGSEANQFLQPGQAIQVATENNGVTSVVFNESAKAPGNHTSTFRNASTAEIMKIIGQFYTTENYVAGNAMHDSFGIYFSEEFTNEVTQEDAVKPFNFTENLGIVNGENILSIERRALPQENEEIQLFSNNYNQSDYTLVLNLQAFENTTVFLLDNYTNEEIQLENGENIFTFSVDSDLEASVSEDRFSFRFGEDNLSVNTSTTNFGIELYPNPSSAGNTFYITTGQFEGNNATVSITDLFGKTVYQAEQLFSDGKVTIEPQSNLSSGVYFVQVEQTGKKVVKRLMVK